MPRRRAWRSAGPGRLHAHRPQDRGVGPFRLRSAVAESWKEQTLLNIVKLRFMDLPALVDSASIVSGYSLRTGVDVGGTISSDNAVIFFFTLADTGSNDKLPLVTIPAQ